MRHTWQLYEGEADTLAWEEGYHHGPVCTVCSEAPCVNCHPDWESWDDCEGEG